ncbi:MAG TPA: 2-oxoglutarate and iron-dependent oxygenase domain-containing protein [Chitinophagales bacterium]|nr:2-oxoglutarate and iron-dependent oxygenase domain-containing protein [Chitinophagales bacterium]
MSIVPVVNLQDYISGDTSKKAAFVQALGKAYETIGFVAVEGHGITDETISNFYQLVEQFFALPVEKKLQYEVPEFAGQRGYTSFGREKAKQSEVPDLKEFWQIGQYVEGEVMPKADYPDNMDVSELEGFNAVGKDLYKSFERAGAHLLRAIANYLDIDENYFAPKIKNGNSILRAIHYPPIINEPKNAIRAEQHEDINLITLLVGASADGLQLLTREGKWVDVKAGPGQIVVNVGDMLQRLTNNVLRSTTHRVVNPPRELWGTHRYSIPFFLHPRSEMPLDCLEDCITENNPIAFEPITAGEYLDERLREIGLKK